MLPVEEDIYNRYKQFREVLGQRMKPGLTFGEVAEDMREEWGNTYWYYYIFGRQYSNPVNRQHNEVQSYELVIDAPTDLDRYKQVALNEVRARMHQQMLTHAVIEAMDYLDCFIKLCSYGYVISNSNREDKYFEIIEDSQSYEEPAPLSNDATL